MTDVSSTSPSKRETNRRETRERIQDAVLDALASGDIRSLNHDRIAEMTGIARRTIYRYFPDQEALLRGAWLRVQDHAGPNVGLPDTVEDILDTVETTYTGFDRIPSIITAIRTTPQGRALRLAANPDRVARYTSVLADTVAALPPEDRIPVTALVQLLHTTVWLEMHDHWGLSGKEIARVVGWALRVMLADLAARGGRPLDEGPA